MKQSTTEFVDYFEVLQLSPNAELGEVEAAFQSLARPFEDSKKAGNPEAFQKLFTAYRVLGDRELRAAYEADYRTQKSPAEVSPKQERPPSWQTSGQGSPQDSNRPRQRSGTNEGQSIVAALKKDAQDVRLCMLDALYKKRINDFDHPGMTILEIERSSGYPRDRLHVAAWYLREKRFIQPDNSRYAITVEGMDEYEASGEADAVSDKTADDEAANDKTLPANEAGNDAMQSLRGLSGAVLSSKPPPITQDQSQMNTADHAH